MIKAILLSLAFAFSQNGQGIPVESPDINVAPAAVVETPAPVPPAEEVIQPESAPAEEPDVIEVQAEDCYTEPQEDLPPPADSFEENGMTPLGVYHITHYSLEECGNCIGAAEVPDGMVEGLSCAMPEYWMLGHTVLIENYGFFRVDDISPDGVADIFHYDAASAVGEDWQMVYLVE